MYHRFSLIYIVSCILHAVTQWILDWVPFVDPSPEPESPPEWWYYYNGWWDWYGNRNARGVPNAHLIRCYISGSFRALGYWVEEIGNWALDTAKNWVRGIVGWVKWGYDTFQRWVESLDLRLGQGMVHFAQNVVEALGKVYNWIPAPIRLALSSWDDLWSEIKASVRNWVTNTYHDLITLGKRGWDWVSGIGDTIRQWWDAARGVLDDFRANPVAFITSRLGLPWSRLTWFNTNALDWYMSLWSNFRLDLSAFLADPAGFIYSRLEAHLERLW